VLQRLHDEVPADHFTLGWLVHSLHKRSFGIIMLIIALVAIAPGLSIVAGLLLMIPAFQMIAGKPAPVFPRRIAARSLPTQRLAEAVQRSVPVLRFLEKVVHPRWHTPLEATKRMVGAAVIMLSATLVFIPIPLSNVVPALVIALISLAYIEEDGALLSIAALATTIVMTVAAAAVWEMAIGAKWVVHLW
jgi:hypothetical protein